MSTAAASMIDSSKPLDVQFVEQNNIIEDMNGADRLSDAQHKKRNKHYAIQRELLRQIARSGVEQLRVTWTMTLDHQDEAMQRLHAQVEETLGRVDSLWLAKQLAKAQPAKARVA